MENFVVSARKYRPSTFNMVVGQPVIVQTLKNAIRSNSLAQAFLFTGPRGIGKTTCARILAKTINCLNLQPDIEPCNECDSCQSFNRSASFNIQELDAASNSGVDDIRALVDQVRIPPQAGKFKVYIIDEVHMLSASAFNAFLKTLEEPPPYAKFILATTERHKILPTILSRCQIYDFKRITITDIAKHLSWVAQQEQIEVEDEAFHVIAQKADGAMRDALSIFDQIVSYSGKTVAYKDVIQNLNLLDYEYYFSIMDKVGSGDYPGALLILDEIIDKGFDGHQFINGLGGHIRNLMLCKDASVAKLLESTEALKGRYTKQAQEMSVVWLVDALDFISESDINYRLASNKRLHLELLLLKLSGTGTTGPEKKNDLSEQQVDQQKARSIVTASPHQPKEQNQNTKPSPEKQKLIKSNAEIAESQQPSLKPDSQESVPQKNEVGEPQQAAASLQKKHESVTPKKRLSITGLMSASDNPEKDRVKDSSVKPNREITPLNENEIQQLVTQYAEKANEATPAFSAALISNPIKIDDDNTILLTFSNSIAANQDLLSSLEDFIRSNITESWFRIKPVIDSSLVPKKVILTPKERYERMNEKYPELNDFVKKLGLEYES